MKRGFTLIELLVVVAIIAALIAILLPSLNKAKTVAKLAVCASNQHQIAIGAVSYAAENRAKLMSTRKTPWSGDGRHPEYINTDPQSTTDEWNLHRIQPYVNGFDLESKESKGVFICPSVSEEFYTWLAAGHWDAQWPSGRRFTQLSYGYYAGVDRWATSERRNGAEDELCQSRPGGSDRVLISDILLPNGNGSLFRYNHGTKGWAWSWADNNWAGGLEELAPPSVTGLNQAFGDGSVRWKDAAEIATDQMFNSASYPDGWVDRGGGNPAYY